ncbi:hypothetical protein AVDCRST_MAG94-6399, partial [uncultured Leptolyngbya sp.]
MEWLAKLLFSKRLYCLNRFLQHNLKRHLAVDTLGFPFFTHCTGANVSDDAGLVEMLTLNLEYFK